MSIYSDYVARENDLANAIDNQALDGFNKTRGWTEYYHRHHELLNGLWDAIGSGRDMYLNVIKRNAFTNGVPNDQGWGQWFKGTVTDLPGGANALNNWNSLSDSQKQSFIDQSARRRMAYDWHYGVGGYGTPGGPGYPPGKDRNFSTFSITTHWTKENGQYIPKVPKNIITLNSSGTNYLNAKAKEDAQDVFGHYHWTTSGKNESRALPGQKFYVNDNGKLTYNSNFVGAGLRNNYDSIANSFNNSKGGNYKALMEGTKNSLYGRYLSDLTGGDISNPNTGDFAILSGYYLKNKVDPVDVKSFLQPPTGGFDADYYAGTSHGQAALNRWNEAQTGVLGALPDLDIVGAYGNNYGNYLHNYYSDIKRSGISDLENRGNKEEETAASNNYYENWDNFTEEEKKIFRDQMLGLTTKRPSGGYDIEWGEPYLKDAEGNIIYETDEFGNQVPVINKDAVSFLESSVFNVFGKKDLEQQDKFQALALDVLKTTVDKLKTERKKESQLNIYKGLPGFNEIYGANSSIANSLLGDSGIGGYLSMAGINVDKMTESLEDQLSGVTGISNNSTVYNWQKWFDETLLERYENLEEVTGRLRADIEDLNPILDETKWNSFKQQVEEINIEEEPNRWNKLLEDNNLSKGFTKERVLEIKDPNNWKALLEKYDLSPDLNKEEAINLLTDEEKEINKIYTLEDTFKKSFIDDYIKPRFDQSKSMDEFISYLDTLDENEQNVFQTQDAMQALKNVASAYSAAKLNQINATPDQYFDSTFYFDPTVAIDERFPGVKDSDYMTQKEQVQADYDAAQANPDSVIPGTVSDAQPEGITWNQYAYYYGVDLGNKDQFARLHYDAIGKGKNYDPAKDITSIGDIKGYIVDTVIPKVSEAKLDLGDAAFSEFTTPEEFADHLLEGIDPSENNPEWKEILEQFGLDYDASLDEVKDYIIDVTRTGAAKDIREAIKFLNERKLKPTQKRLGVSYIEREEDAKDIDPENQSALYKIFSEAGYAGTEDEFFKEFMPDAERGDIQFVTQAMGPGFKLDELSDDPFAALSQIGGMLGEGPGNIFGEKEKETDDDSKTNYFNLFGDDEKDDDYYSGAGRDYIKEYTSFFSS